MRVSTRVRFDLVYSAGVGRAKVKNTMDQHTEMRKNMETLCDMKRPPVSAESHPIQAGDLQSENVAGRGSLVTGRAWHLMMSDDGKEIVEELLMAARFFPTTAKRR